MSEWKTCELETVCERLSSGKGISAKLISDTGTFPVYGGNGIRGYTSTSNFKGDCAIIGRQGAYCGNVRYFKGEAYMTEHAVVVCANGDNCTRYLAYLLSTMNLGRLSGQSAQPGLSVKTLGKQEIRIPTKDIQIKISELLGSLDEKIKQNERINDNLQEQAHAVFRSWFVDYTPFGGSAPSDSFPSTLGKVCSCELGGTPSRAKAEYWNGNIPWINSGEVNLFRITKPSETITELGLSKSATKLLPAKTTVIAITGATLGQISLLEIESCANQSVVGVVPNEQLPYEFIYPFIFNNIEELISHQTGGAQQHINKQNVEGLPIIVPSKTIMNDYVSLVGGYYSSIANNCFENERLAELRDILLPRLMSGELDVSNIDL